MVKSVSNDENIKKALPKRTTTKDKGVKDLIALNIVMNKLFKAELNSIVS